MLPAEFRHGTRDPADGACAESGADPIGAAQASFSALSTYALTLRSASAHGEKVRLRYAFRKPGFVRMDFIEPHGGATLIYSPLTKAARVWPRGYPRFPSLELAADNPLIRGPHGHRVDESDLGALLHNIRALQEVGSTCVGGEERIGTRRTTQVVVEGAPGRTVARVHRYLLWLDAASALPLRVVSESVLGAPIDTVVMDDLCVDVALPPDFFG